MCRVMTIMVQPEDEEETPPVQKYKIRRHFHLLKLVWEVAAVQDHETRRRVTLRDGGKRVMEHVVVHPKRIRSHKFLGSSRTTGKHRHMPHCERCCRRTPTPSLST